MKLTIELTIDEQNLRDLLVTAVEGGSNYWATFSEVQRDADLNILRCRVVEQEPHSEDSKRVNRWIEPRDLLSGLDRLVNPPEWRRGLPGTMTPAVALKHFSDAVMDWPNDCGDATTADVVLQMAIFGEVVYG